MSKAKSQPYLVHTLDRGTTTIPSKMDAEKKRVKNAKRSGKKKK